ncbi:hypothetical protein BP5796_02543 [Coleophoma crateriformis]|uniref:Peroxin/Ferlin domain-containing protein n=1 Tax=Coleophoma crateriformis TaxID=565419 RepID=A0A3D8T047_9HELO|nr:hypothetical protein BP5796_02543 [Coleophoma crateriformis]
MSYLPSQHRRAEPLKPSDYDHEIVLVDTALSRSQSAGDSRPLTPGATSDSSSRRLSDAPLHKRDSLRKELTRRKYNKYQDRHLDDPVFQGTGELNTGEDDVQGTEADDSTEEDRGRRRAEPESCIDILYENQRGLFLCGISYFSAKALGNLDPPEWTTIYGKPSFTNIYNHQVPDPTWEWQWQDWRINHDDGVDEDGWEYSFAFAKQFSWHLPGCLNNFVRRRAWIRKRVKKGLGYKVQESHRLNEDYFTIHSMQMRTHSRHSSTRDGGSLVRLNADQSDLEAMEKRDITDIPTLLKALRAARIDREKMEVVENFIQNGGDELYYLREHMHEIMGQFIFQASRKLFLASLIKMLDQVSARESRELKDESDDKNSNQDRQLRNLQGAIKAADDEVKRLEFWSDVKEMAEKGETKGAVDEAQGWDSSWNGLDDSGPRDVISEKLLPGADDCLGQHKDVDALQLRPNGKGKEKATV